MSDSRLLDYLQSGTAAERALFTPTPPSTGYTYVWMEEDTGKVYVWKGSTSTWVEIGTGAKLDDLAAPDDNTDLNASTTKHGLLVKATAPASGLRNVVAIDNGETAYTNKALFDATNPAALGTAAPGTQQAAARRDHVHANPAIDTLAAATDITTLNSSTSAHGLLKKLSNSATDYMDGTGNWSVPAGGGGSGVLTTTVTLSNAQVGSLSTTPIQLIAAPGANKRILCVGGMVEFNVPSGYGANLTIRIVHGTDQSYSYVLSNNIVGGFGAARNFFVFSVAEPGVHTAANFDPRNTAVNVKGTTDIGTGDAAATMKITLHYVTIDTI